MVGAEIVGWCWVWLTLWGGQPQAGELGRLYEAEYARVVAEQGEASEAAGKAARDAGLFYLRASQESAEPGAARAVQWLARARTVLAEEELEEAYAQALRAAREPEAVAVLRALAAKTKNRGRAARAYSQLAEMGAEGKTPVEWLRLALQQEESVGRWNDLGLKLQEQEDWAGAVASFRKALAMDRRVADPEKAATLNNLASALWGSGKPVEALALQRRALAMLQGSLGPGHVRTALAESNLADMLQASGQKAEARRLYGRAYETFAAKLGPAHSWTREALAKRAER